MAVRGKVASKAHGGAVAAPAGPAAAPKPRAAPIRRDAIATFLQAKLTVNAPDDAYEKEADSVAARILQMPEGQRKPRLDRAGQALAGMQRRADEEDKAAPMQREAKEEEAQTAPLQRETEEDEAQTAPLQRETEEDEAQTAPLQREAEEDEAQTAPLQREAKEDEAQTAPLQREAEEDEAQMAPLQREAEEDEAQMAPLQREAEEDEAQTAPLQREAEEDEAPMQAKRASARRRRMTRGFEERLWLLRSTGGEPLAPALSAFMETRFGKSFAGVRVHTGADAAALAEGARARAFTVGRDIVFNRAEYRPDSDTGRRLVAHELTHVLQQQGGLHSVQREIFAPEADTMRRAPKGEALLRQLEEVMGLDDARMPEAIRTILSEILRTAADSPESPRLAALLSDRAEAAETRRSIETTEYMLRLTVLRGETGAQAQWTLTRTGDRAPFFRYAHESVAEAAVPEGGLDDDRVAVATPIPPDYRSDPGVSPMAGQQPTPEPRPDLSPPPEPAVRTAPPPDTSALAEADAPTKAEPETENGAGRGDGSGSDSPETPRAPVDQEPDDPVEAETPPPDAEVRRSARPGAPRDLGAEAAAAVAITLREPGAPLAPPLAAEMCAELDADLSAVRIHHGPAAARAARRLGARAFAAGPHVVFAAHRFRPDTREGRALLAHELTHVRQWREGRGDAEALRRDEECPPPEPVPEVEVVPSPEGPAGDPAFQGVEARAENRADSQSAHGAGEGKSDHANAAAEVTEGENRTHAQTDQVGTMATAAANPPAFDRSAFIASVLAEVERIAPETLKDVVEFDSRGTAGQVRSAVEGEAASATGDTQAPLDEAATADPGPGQSPRTAEPLEVEPPGAEPGSIRADRAMPPPRTESEVDLRSGTVRAENILREACITREYMDEHGDPELGAAAQAQDGLAEATEAAEPSYREQEAATLANARAGASQEGQAGVGGLFVTRAGNFAEVGNAQGATAVENARKRQAVAAEVDTIFTDTQTRVTQRLELMTTEVNTTFDTEAGEAVAAFESFIRVNAELYENNWVEDLLDIFADILFDPPPREVWDFYGEGRRQFITDMEGVIGSVADIVETGLREAREIVDEGKAKAEEKLATLGDDLADFRTEIADQMNDRFRGLEGDIDSAQRAMVSNLAQRYVGSLERMREIENQVRDEYTTWVDRAEAAFHAAVDYVVGWVERLVAVVGGAATRIIRDPGTFLSNLGAGIIQGFTMFMENIGDNIKSAVVTWLTGNLGSAGIQVPKSFDAKGLIGFLLEIAGLGIANIKNIARKVFGARIVSLIERGVEGAEQIKRIFDILVAEGPGGLFQFLASEFARMKDEVLAGIGKALAESLVIAGIKKVLGIISGLVSGGIGTIITIVTTIIDVVLWIRDNAASLAELISTIAGMAVAVLEGQVGALAGAINTVLKRLLPLVLGFVGALVGIGGVVKKIQDIFKMIRKPATKAITALFMKLKKAIGKLFKKPSKKEANSKKEKKLSPSKAVNEITAKLGAPTKTKDPGAALTETKALADTLRSTYQPRVTKGTIRIEILDTSPAGVTRDGDIDFEVSVNPKKRGRTPVRSAEELLADATSALTRLERKLRDAAEMFPRDERRAEELKPTAPQISEMRGLFKKALEAEAGRPLSRNELSSWLQEKGFSERIGTLERGRANLQNALAVGGGAEHTSGARGSTGDTHAAGRRTKARQEQRAQDRLLEDVSGSDEDGD